LPGSCPTNPAATLRRRIAAINHRLTATGLAPPGSAADAITLTATDSPVLCGPCAITRWLRVLDVVMTKPSHRVLAKQIDGVDPVTDQSPHLCRSTRQLSPLILHVPLLPSIDQWGYVPFQLRRLTPHSLSRLVQQMLAGDFVTHRRIPVDEVPEPEQPAPVPVEVRGCTAGKRRNGHGPGAGPTSSTSPESTTS
jgi:hypothetical protein